jgi:hypothetical protein
MRIFVAAFMVSLITSCGPSKDSGAVDQNFPLIDEGDSQSLAEGFSCRSEMAVFVKRMKELKPKSSVACIVKFLSDGSNQALQSDLKGVDLRGKAWIFWAARSDGTNEVRARLCSALNKRIGALAVRLKTTNNQVTCGQNVLSLAGSPNAVSEPAPVESAPVDSTAYAPAPTTPVVQPTAPTDDR